jgi:flagellar biosynthesis protein FliP
LSEHGGSKSFFRWGLCAILFLVVGTRAVGQTVTPANLPDINPFNVPDVRGFLPTATDTKGVSVTLQILVLMTVLSLVPSVLIMTTCFTRILVVLSLLRQAMATPQLPPGQVMLGLSLFMTIMVMGPTWGRINRDALQPYLANEMGQREAMDLAMGHMRLFMFRQIDRSDNHEDVFLFQEYATGVPVPRSATLKLSEVGTTSLIPAFILSELKTAFVMGFRIYLPFLVIDMVISSILISMGMMMLPPVLISLPFKILLFVLSDGWHLIVQTLLYSFDNVRVV